MRLDRADGMPGLTRDLSDRKLAKVAQNDGLPIRLRKRGHRLLDQAIALGHEHVGKRLRASRDRERVARLVIQRDKPPLKLGRSKRAIYGDPANQPVTPPPPPP